MIDFLIDINKEKGILTIEEVFIKKPVCPLIVSNPTLDFLAWGDPINKDEFKKKISKHAGIECIINNLYGHYYYFLIDKINNSIFAGNSLFGILPVYYKEGSHNLLISNDPFAINNISKGGKYNKRFMLENILFSYPLFNQSIIEGINLLPVNSFIEYSRGMLYIKRHNEIEEFFSMTPMTWRKAADNISDIFIESSKKYFPEEPFYTSLTGGFDGRTLTSCAKYFNKEFSTYCFGTADCSDMKISGSLAGLSGLRFKGINLGETYIKYHSKDFGLDFITGSHGSASFSRAHYLYSARELSGEAKVLISGNFGSEVLRSPHQPGVLMSSNLFSLLMAKNYDYGIKMVELSPEWGWIRKSSFIEEWESLKEELKTLSWFIQGSNKMSKNQHLYKIIFNEVFRKYFGAEIENQSKYVSNRTPFLDINFLKAILGTGLAGVNSDFLTSNPLKRFKGQVLYAYIIKKTFPEFGREMTDKGYPPEYLLSRSGNIMLARSYADKLLKKGRSSNEDPYSVNSAFEFNRDFWKNQLIEGALFNKENILKAIENPGSMRDSLFIALSQSGYINSIRTKFMC